MTSGPFLKEDTHYILVYANDIILACKIRQFKPNMDRGGVSALSGTRDKLSRVYK